MKPVKAKVYGRPKYRAAEYVSWHPRRPHVERFIDGVLIIRENIRWFMEMEAYEIG